MNLAHQRLSVIHDEDGFFVKVFPFPVPGDPPWAGESMWVEVVRGDENNGIGRLDNHPVCCTVAKYGDLIEYGGGTEEVRPHFVRVVESTKDE